jgi:hypothetical protein
VKIEKRVSIHPRFLTKTPFYFEYTIIPLPFFQSFKKFIPAFFDPVSIILFDRFYLKTYIVTTIKLSVFLFISIEIKKEKK